MSNTTSLVVTFTNPDAAGADGVNAHLSAEVDSRPEGLNGGKTSFKPGETCWFLVFKSSNVTLSEPVSSAGSIAGGQTVTGIKKTQELTFSNTDSNTLSVPSTGLSTTKWLGRSLGLLTLNADKLTVKAASKGVAVARVEYLCNATAFSIQSPVELSGETSFSISVLIEGTIV